MAVLFSTVQLTVRAIAVAMALILPALTSPVLAQSKPDDCFADLQNGKSAEIVCTFPVIPSERERAELEKQTRGVLKNAVCSVAIKIDRALVTAAVEQQDYIFQAPPQPVTCEVTAHIKSVSTFPISGTFAPRVVFKGGQATEASPGMGNVMGVSSIISWPVVTYVNRGGMVRDGMLKVVNAWVMHMRARKQAQVR